MEYIEVDASRLAFLDEFVEGVSCGVVPEGGVRSSMVAHCFVLGCSVTTRVCGC